MGLQTGTQQSTTEIPTQWERQRLTKAPEVAPWGHVSALPAARWLLCTRACTSHPPQLFLFILFWLLIAPSSVYCVTPSVARDLSLLLQVLAVLLTFNVEC